MIVRYEGRVPAMASRTKCERKFFTPTTLALESKSGARVSCSRIQQPVPTLDLVCARSGSVRHRRGTDR